MREVQGEQGQDETAHVDDYLIEDVEVVDQGFLPHVVLLTGHCNKHQQSGQLQCEYLNDR